MVCSLRILLLAFLSIPIVLAQQQDGRCDVTREVVSYTPCRNCISNVFFSCPSGTVQNSTGQGLNDCSYRVFFFFTQRGCRHSCLSTVVTEERCCDGYWGTNCDPCPGVNGATGECSGRGNCSSGIDGDGLCDCEDSFNGTNCELCSDEDVFGPECTSVCTCENGECNNGPSGDGYCQQDTCEEGFTGENCHLKINTTACLNTICGDNGYCVEDTDNSTRCVCNPDYHFDPNGGINCIAIDHCELDTHNCDDNATCYYTEPNQYNCTCDDGFTGDGVFCEAIDPCQSDNGGCGMNTVCMFEGPGLSSCECLEGYENVSAGCSPINPCEAGTVNCSDLANCTYIGPGIARCDCPTGYVENKGECYGSLLERLEDIYESGEYELDDFLSLIKEQELEQLLDSGGIFTVFAPINSAFEETMLTDDEVTVLLLAHIIPAEVTAMVSTPTNYATLAGHIVEITPNNNYTIVDSTVSVGIIEPNLLAYNGLINILNGVAMIPESARPSITSTQNTSAWDVISTWDRLSQFSSFIQLANMIEDFEFSNITVLAPTDEAFEALEPGAVPYLQGPNGIHDLVTIITNHLVNEEISITDLVMRQTLQTAESNSYPITLNANGSISLGAVKLIINNIAVDNGMVHVIDAVLKPPELDPIVNRSCPITNEDTLSLSCGNCLSIPNCPLIYDSSVVRLCINFFSFITIGCRRICTRTIVTPRCCDGFYGTDCLPCPDNHANPCNGNGQCLDGINGNGTCVCDNAFNGTTCELCVKPDYFGPNCSQSCTCVNGFCDDGPMGSGQCMPGSCDEGFIGDNCDVGIPHCGVLNSTCHLYATCQLINNTEMCTCRRGYRGDGMLSCQPINPCQEPNRGGCHDQASCTYNGPGKSTCTCNSGWSGDGTSCVVIDPCALPSRGGCDSNAVCTFTAPGENSCTCNFGYRGNGMSCTAINTCEINRGNCHLQATCLYTGPGTNNCSCNDGYIGDGYNCIGDLLTEIGNNPNVSMFYRLLQQSHLEQLLTRSDDNNYTVFIPSNSAIASASSSSEQYSVWTEEHTLPLLIQHHLVARVYSLSSLKTHVGSLPTLLGNDVLTVTNVSLNGTNIVHINTAGIVLSDFLAQNGVYHILDEMLFPDDAHLPTELPLTVDVLSNLTNFTILLELIKRFNITDMLNNSTFTILAPTDDAFSYLSEDEIGNLTINNLQYHLYPGSLPVETIFEGLQLYSQVENAAPLTFDIDDNSTITVNGIPLVGVDYHARNSSVILPITDVLQPILSRCDNRSVSTVNGTCRSCLLGSSCPPGTTFVEYDRTCTYTITIFGFSLTFRGCVSVCQQVDITPRCCEGFYGPDCDACPQVDGYICSGRGNCNDSITGNGQCSCIDNYGGTACETCLPNMYGENCDQVCKCSSNGYCNDGVNGDGRCSCSPGWQGDRCNTLVNSTICNSTCHEFAYCDEAIKMCVCKEGYTGNGTYCSEIDVCVDNGGCDPMATCISDPTAPGGRMCTCAPHQYTGDGIVCLPLDPCIAAANGGCDSNAKCVMTGPGLRACMCNAGYTGDGTRSCDFINACELTFNGGCSTNAYCMPTGPAQKKCFCNENYVGDGYTCAGTLRQVIATHTSLTTLNSYMNQQNSYGQSIGTFLNDNGVFTGFAISDAGYRALMDSADNDTLALFSNPDALERLIQYSFVGCTVLTAESLQSVSILTSLMGSSLHLTNSSSGVRVNNISLSVENVFGANGLIHIINTAILPPSDDLIVGDTSDTLATVLNTNGFTYLQTGLQLAGSDIVEALFSPSLAPFTIFAPVDGAFDSELLTFFRRLFGRNNRPRLLSFVEFHMTSGAILSPSDLSNITHLITVQGGVIRIECNQGDLFINGNRIVLRQIPFDRGVIYGIDSVLMPPGEGGDCDVPTTMSVWTNCSGSCSYDCPGGYTPVSNTTSQLDCMLPDNITGCTQMCIKSSFERQCCTGYYGDNCTACPTISGATCSGVVPCDDGIDGVGCNCTAPYTGQACEGCIDGYMRNGSSCVVMTTSSSLTPTIITATTTTTAISPSSTTSISGSISSSTTTLTTTSSMSSSVAKTSTLQSMLTSSSISSLTSMTSSSILSMTSMTSSSTSSMTSMTSSSMTSMTSSVSPLTSIKSSVLSMTSMTSSISSMTSSSMTSMTSPSLTSMKSSSILSMTSMTSSSPMTLMTSSSISPLTSTSLSSLTSLTSKTPIVTSSFVTSSTMTSSSVMSIPVSSTIPASTMILTTNTSTSSATNPSSTVVVTTISASQSGASTSQSGASTSQSGTSTSQSGVSTMNTSIGVAQTPGASSSQGSNNVGMAVGVSISVVVVILIVIVVIVIGIYKYSKKRGYFSFKDRMTYKTNDDGVILTMDSPSPVAYNNPLYSGPGDDSFLDTGSDNYLTNPIYDGFDNEV